MQMVCMPERRKRKGPFDVRFRREPQDFTLGFGPRRIGAGQAVEQGFCVDDAAESSLGYSARFANTKGRRNPPTPPLSSGFVARAGFEPATSGL